MYEIKDNTYIYSTFTNDNGSIIACRSRYGRCEGENIFKYLGISDGEQDFLTVNLKSDCPTIVAVCGKRQGKDTVVIFISHLMNSSSFGIAIEICDNPGEELYAIRFGGLDKLVLSDEASEISSLPESFNCVAGKYMRVADSMRDILSITRKFRKGHTKYGISQIFDLIELEASFVGVGLELYNARDNNISCIVNCSFSMGFLTAALFVLLMSARTYAPDRCLTVVFSDNQGRLFVECLFENTEQGELFFQRYIENVAGMLGISLWFENEKDKFKCKFSPYIPDPSNAGLKQDLFSRT